MVADSQSIRCRVTYPTRDKSLPPSGIRLINCNEQMKYKSYIQGLKWAGIKTLLYELAWDNQLDISILEHDKGWFRETIYYGLNGEDENIKCFNRQLKLVVEKYNNKTISVTAYQKNNVQYTPERFQKEVSG